MDMFRLVNAQQQPFIQSGYGAMGKLNTLLGIGGHSPAPGVGMAPPMGSPNQQGYIPNPQGGMDMRIPSPVSQGPRAMGAPGAPNSNPRLKQLLALRAANGDTEAARMLGMQ